MASNTLTIKCKTQSGPYTLSELTPNSTVLDLKRCVQKLTQIKPEAMKILSGYPPKALGSDKDGSKLCEVNISSGDTVIIETLKIPSVEVAEAACVSSSSAGYAPVPAQVELKRFISKEKELRKMMLAQGGILMRHVVPSDNSCLFNSIYFILSNGDLNAQKSYEMREIIAATVHNNPEKYNAAFLGKPNSEYCDWILDDNHWGGAIELAILSEHFRLEIVAVDTMTQGMLRFGENDNHSHRIFLIYDGIHYDPLILELDSTRQAMFSVTETLVMEMALEIAKEAQSSRQYTDMANFTVACQVCTARLRGDREAVEHARITGHNQFGEL